jgi:superfamily I DNA and/or RNA helicase
MWDDVLVVAPYNVQVTLLGERLASRGVRVDTVDKFPRPVIQTPERS